MDAFVQKRTIRSEAEQAALIERFVAKMSSLKSFAVSLTHDQMRADDLVQATILRAMESAERFDGDNVGAWLFTILRNLFRSDYRKHKREVEFDPDVVEKMHWTNLFKEEMETAQDFNKILMCLALLPMRQRDALIAIGYLGLTYDEASLILGCAVGTIKSRVNRARDSLAENLEMNQIVQLDLSPLRNAARGVPMQHPYYPIAAAYAELFSESDDVRDGEFVGKSSGAIKLLPESEQLWHDLVASGALEDEAPSCIQR